MATVTKFPLHVFYDGSCAVCNREMQIYRQRESGGELKFFDISAPGFDAAEHDVSIEELMKELHVREADGQFHTGTAAFARIWSAFPDSPLYRLLERAVSLPGISKGADLGYAALAHFRHLLPKTGSHNGSCRLH